MLRTCTEHSTLLLFMHGLCSMILNDCTSSVQSNVCVAVNCRDTLNALGGHYVLNSGTFLGPSKLLLTYIDAMLEELQQRWHCRRLHGSDQAIHNFLVYTGKFIGTGMLTCACVLASGAPLTCQCIAVPHFPPACLTSPLYSFVAGLSVVTFYQNVGIVGTDLIFCIVLNFSELVLQFFAAQPEGQSHTSLD